MAIAGEWVHKIFGEKSVKPLRPLILGSFCMLILVYLLVLVPRVVPCRLHHAGGLLTNFGCQGLKLSIFVQFLDIVVAP